MNKKSSKLVALTLVAAAVGVGAYYSVSPYLESGPFKWGDEPVIANIPNSEESLHVEYPSVYQTGDGVGLLYSAYGDDHRWRLKLATSSDSGWNFTKQGSIFPESNLPFKGNYAFPFVREVTDKDGAKAYELYFSASDDGSGLYSAIYRSRSSNGLNWDIPERFLAGNALDPIVLKQGDKDYIIYTANKNNSNVVMKAEINQDASAGAPRVIYTPKVGIYTLGLLKLNGRNVVVVEEPSSWTAMCFDNTGEVISNLGQPLTSFEKKENKRWDALKYGMNFFDAGGEHKIYYNGIEGHGVETGGQIAVGTYDPEMIAAKLNLSNCQ